MSRPASWAALAVTVATVSPACRPMGGHPAPSEVRLLLASPPAPSFARALEPRTFRWPEDHGPHYDYQTEWWYYTGNLRDEDGREVAYQLTFFRRGLTPGPPSGEGLETNQVFFAHFALTDARRGSHVAHERWSRGAAGLAGAAAPPLRCVVLDWSAESPAGNDARVHLRARDGGDALDLVLDRTKPMVLHGDHGLSAKGGAPGNASYYVSATRLASRGRLMSGGEAMTVSGESWFDHEWSTSALAPDALGWDWISLQLDDGTDIMYFRIRREDGSDDPASGGTLVDARGASRRLDGGDVSLSHTGTWTSPRGTRYPSGWILDLPDEALRLSLEPLVQDQEVRLAFTYWEGAVRVSGRRGSQEVAGRGFVELTGYAAPMRQTF